MEVCNRIYIELSHDFEAVKQEYCFCSKQLMRIIFFHENLRHTWDSCRNVIYFILPIHDAVGYSIKNVSYNENKCYIVFKQKCLEFFYLLKVVSNIYLPLCHWAHSDI